MAPRKDSPSKSRFKQFPSETCPRPPRLNPLSPPRSSVLQLVLPLAPTIWCVLKGLHYTLSFSPEYELFQSRDLVGSSPSGHLQSQVQCRCTGGSQWLFCGGRVAGWKGGSVAGWLGKRVVRGGKRRRMAGRKKARKGKREHGSADRGGRNR